MTIEIERKWVPESIPPTEVLGPGERLRQGYLAAEAGVAVRVRFSASATTLTVKGGSGLSRTEVELAVADREHGEALWALTVGRRIEKVRHRVAIGAHTAEVDVYDGALAGSCTVEVEFDSLDDARAFVAPPWFGIEVTDDERWSNVSLARYGRPAEPC